MILASTPELLFMSCLLLSGGEPSGPAAPMHIDAGGTESSSAAQELTLVRYDLRTVLPQFDMGGSWRQSLVSELADPDSEFPNVDVHSLYEDAPSEVVLDVITQVLGDELHYEGRELSLEGEHGLLLLAPPAVQEQVVSVLDALEQALSATVEVQVDLFTLEASAEDPAWPAIASGVVTGQQADRLTERLMEQGARSVRHGMRLSSGRTAIIDQSKRISFTGDYDVEVAQGAFTFDPVGMHLSAGLRILARGVPTRGGTALSLVISNHSMVGGVRERPIYLAGAVSHPQEGGLEFVTGPETLQTVDLSTHAFACTTFLPDSGAVVMTSASTQQGRRSLQVIVLRSQGGGRGPLHRVAIPGTDRSLILVNAEALRRPSFEFESGVFYFGHPFLFATLNGEPSSFLFDWLPYRFSVWRQLGPWAVIVTAPSWEDRGGADLERLVNTASAIDKTVHVRVELTSTEASATPLARWSLPILPGTECGLVLGLTSSMMRDYAAEVAQYATVLDPVVTPTFEGLAMRLELSRKGDEIFVSTVGTAQRREKPMASFAVQGAFAARVDQVEEQVFDFDEQRRVKLGQEIRLGAQNSGATSLPGLMLRVGIGN